MKATHIYSDKDCVLRVVTAKMPKDPNITAWELMSPATVKDSLAKSKALQHCKDTSVPVEDLNAAAKLIYKKYRKGDLLQQAAWNIKPDTFYPVEVEYEIQLYKNIKDSDVASGYTHPPEKVARLTPLVEKQKERVKLYFVTGSSGDWDDYTHWTHKIFFSKEAAEKFKGKKNAQLERLKSAIPASAYDADGELDMEKEGWMRYHNILKYHNFIVVEKATEDSQLKPSSLQINTTPSKREFLNANSPKNKLVEIEQEPVEPAREKPDFFAHVAGKYVHSKFASHSRIPIQSVNERESRAYVAGCEYVWSDYVTPLQEKQIDFAVWYSGMDKQKVLNAYQRYLKEKNP